MSAPADHTIVPALLDALDAGPVTIGHGRIAGHAGYTDPTRRAVMLNPDAASSAGEQLVESLGHLTSAMPGVEDVDQAAARTAREQVIRSAIAYGVMCTSREWNGDTWCADDDAATTTDLRLDGLLAQYLEQDEPGA